MPGVYLIDIEELREASADGTATGQVADLTAVRDIVAEEVAEYQAVRSAERVAPTVVALRSKAQKVVENELERLNGRLPGIDDRTRAEITRTVRPSRRQTIASAHGAGETVGRRSRRGRLRRGVA